MAPPSPSRQRIITLISILPWALVLFEFLFVLPRYDRLFRQFKLQLDDFTQLLIKISAWIAANVLLSFLITFVLMGVNVAVSVVAQSPKVSRRRRIWLLLLAFGVPCLAFAITWVGVEITHRRLVEGLQR
jgi:type II secretory pathway component PulF